MFQLIDFLFRFNQIRKPLLKLILKIDTKDFSKTRRLMKKYMDINIGKYSYGCFRVDGSIAKGTEIGNFCSIADGVRIGGMNHPMDFVTTHPILYYKSRGFVEFDLNEIEKVGTSKVVISDDVWIGQNAIILPGVRIGKGAVIAAGAVVTKDISSYSICAGVPARVIKKRFSEIVIQELNSIDWATWDDDRIRKNLSSFYNVDTFIENNREKVHDQKKAL